MPDVLDPRKKPLDHEELLHRRELGKNNRRPFERDWMLNLAYLHNEQYVDYVFNTGQLVPLNAPDDATRTVHNVMMKLARVERARMLKTQPRPVVLPGSDSDDDIMTARVLESYFSQLMREWNFPRRLRELTYWIVATGNAWLKWFWSGDSPQVDIVTPFEMYIDPYVRSFQDARWVIQGRFYDEATAWDVYGDAPGAKPEFLVPGSTEKLNILEHRIYSDIGLGSPNANLSGVTVYEYWEPPTKSNEKGRYIVFTDAGIVLGMDFPYAHGKMPFTHATHLVRASSKYAASVLDYERHMQDELNRAESQNIENRNMSNGKWWLPPGLQLEEDPTAEPRQILRPTGEGDNPNLKPELIPGAPYPQWALEYPERLKSFMQDIAGQHEVSNAGVPGRVESGQAIQLLQESDGDVIQDAVFSLQEAISEGFWQTGANTQQFGDEEIIVQTYDKDGQIEVHQLMSGEINLKYQVVIQTTTSLPQSTAGKWDRVLNLVQYGVITPQQAAELLDLSVEDPSLVPASRDRKQAYRENKEMLAGETPMPRMMEDHDAHMKIHADYIKTEDFEQQEPDIQERFLAHYQAHIDQRDQAAMIEARLQQIMQGQAQPEQGAPPGDGAGGPPQGGAPPGPPGPQQTPPTEAGAGPPQVA